MSSQHRKEGSDKQGAHQSQLPNLLASFFCGIWSGARGWTDSQENCEHDGNSIWSCKRSPEVEEVDVLYCKPRVLNSFPPHCPQLSRREDEKASGWQETLESSRSTIRSMEATLGALHGILQSGNKNCCLLYFLNNSFIYGSSASSVFAPLAGSALLYLSHPPLFCWCFSSLHHWPTSPSQSPALVKSWMSLQRSTVSISKTALIICHTKPAPLPMFPTPE